jgi:hypothetical protein
MFTHYFRIVTHAIIVVFAASHHQVKSPGEEINITTHTRIPLEGENTWDG